MATWLAHLRIAEQVYQQIEGLDQEMFYIGNIAPDSGLPDEHWESFTPSTEVTHFLASKASLYYARDLAFFDQYLRGNPSPELGKERFSFLLGYFFHLIIDNLWSIHFDKPLREKYAKEFAVDPKFIWETKMDTYGLDHIFLRDHPQAAFWKVFVRAHYENDCLEHLSAEAINHRIGYIKDYYQTETDEVRAMFKRPFIYLDKAGMDSIVEQFSNILVQVYQRIWVQKKPVEGHESILEMLSDRN